jgi:uncharacterized membrane protein YbhN (UPF0104 family)
VSFVAARKWLERRPLARFAGSVLLLASLLVVLPRQHVLMGVRNLRLPVVAAALPLYLLLHFAGAFKWHILVNRSGTRMAIAQSIQCYFCGLFSNLFLPSVVGGDAVMVALALKKAEKRAGIVMGSFLNRALDLAALLILVGAAAVLLPRGLIARNRHTWNGVLIVTGVGILLCVAAAGALRTWWSSRRLHRLLKEHGDALELLRRPGGMVTPLALSIGIQFGLLALTDWITTASGLQLPLAAWLLAWPLAKLVSMLPVAIAGIGTREIALSAFLAPFGAPASRIVATAVAWDAVMVAGALAGGVVWKGIGWATGRPAGDGG